MKKILMICVMLVTMVVTTFGQKVDYNQYNVVAHKGNITVVEKDGKDYRMVIGPLKNPKKMYAMGHNKELAAGRFNRLIEIIENEKFPKQGRLERFCGSQIRVFTKGEGEQRLFIFKDASSNAKFVLTRQDCLELKDKTEQYSN